MQFILSEPMLHSFVNIKSVLTRPHTGAITKYLQMNTAGFAIELSNMGSKAHKAMLVVI